MLEILSTAPRDNRSDRFKNFLCFFILILLVTIRTSAALANAYKIEIKSFDSPKAGETYCVSNENVCVSTLNFPFISNGRAEQIDVLVFINDQYADIRFKTNGTRLSTAREGWDSFYERIENFSGEPKIVKLYFPSSAIKHDQRYSVPLVVRPFNEFLTAISIKLEIIIAKQAN